MKAIHVLPLGGADPSLAEAISGPLRRTFRTEVAIREFSFNAEQFLDDGRSQYNSTGILLHLKEAYPPLKSGTGVGILALVPFDLFVPVLTYVFGEAEVGGNVAVVSYHRLAPQRYGLPPDDALLRDRLIKEVVHEIGHMFSLIHCAELACVMHSSSYVEEIDLKEGSLCRICLSELSHRR